MAFPATQKNPLASTVWSCVEIGDQKEKQMIAQNDAILSNFTSETRYVYCLNKIPVAKFENLLISFVWHKVPFIYFKLSAQRSIYASIQFIKIARLHKS